MLLLGACRRGGAGGPTLQPSPTYTPRSTPLPSLVPTVAPGAADNPIRLVFVREAGAESQGVLNRAADDVGETLTEAAGLDITVTIADTDAGAVETLCAAHSGQPTAAWVSGLGYAAVSALGCGTAALQVEREVDGESSAAEPFQIIANRDLGISGVNGLNGFTFCRVSVTDYATWLVPSLLLQAEAVPPTTALAEVRDMDDVDALVAAVAAGDCDAAGLPSALYEESVQGSDRADITALRPTVEVPYRLLMLPAELPLGARTALVDALEALAQTDNDALRTLLNADRLAPVGEGDLAQFDAFITRTGIDFGAAD